MKNLIWFRQDLRMTDNRALSAAVKNASDGVVAIFIATPATWKQHEYSSCKVSLILRQLSTLKEGLADLNIPLKFLTVKSFEQVPAALEKSCFDLKIDAVFANRQPLLDEVKRDCEVTDQLALSDISFELFDDVTVLPPRQVLKGDGSPYKVFTPYKRAWLAEIVSSDYSLAASIKKQSETGIKADEIPGSLNGFTGQAHVDLWPAGEKEAIRRLKHFRSKKVEHYSESRDFPGMDLTSRLSPYLAIGALSIRQCLHAMLKVTGAQQLSDVQAYPGPGIWLSELIWRDFYHSIAVSYPQVVRGEAFLPETDFLPWSDSERDFKAWCEGKTGFPLVDAAMRQLNQTGWMHNRLRMVVAMFLTKTLFINWRQGEQYFMSHLIDGDFPANNGGWQWSASSGTDAAPYFRIFNPTAQSRRFDSGGEFIRQYCPELSGLSDKAIHQPNSMERQMCNYPEPIVDYSAMRKHVISCFKQLKEMK